MRYNSPNTPFDNLRTFVYRGGSPVTTALLLANGLSFLIAFLLPSMQMWFVNYIAFTPTALFHAPWTFVTYPLVYLDVSTQGIWNFLLGGFFFYTWGGSLERSWGSARYAWLFGILAVISAAFLLLGAFLLHGLVLLDGFFLPLACVTVAFCTLRPEETLSFIFFPLAAKYVGWIAVLFTVVFFGQGGQPLLGLFGCGGLLMAYLYVRYGRHWADVGTYGASRRTARGPDLRVYPAARAASQTTLDGSRKRSAFDFAGRFKDWQERRKLEKLLRNSGFSDLEPRWRDDEERRRR